MHKTTIDPSRLCGPLELLHETVAHAMLLGSATTTESEPPWRAALAMATTAAAAAAAAASAGSSSNRGNLLSEAHLKKMLHAYVSPLLEFVQLLAPNSLVS